MSSDKLSEKAALLFEECIDISDPEKQAAFLAAACADCAELRIEVEALLCAHLSSGGFLRGGTPPRTAPLDPRSDTELVDIKPGSCVGPYRLLGPIGEGGTSVVFLAEQVEPVRRWVAVKIIKPGMDTRNVIVRFSLERQALALMDHPGIAKLLDAGATSNGRPYFIMELVSGVAITRYCDEHQFTIRKRLDLLIQICSAVFHAHQRGIIHRDLKPDNILACDLDGRPTLKIIDFGIAKVLRTWDLENPIQTSGMPFLGTPAYMSPEQAQLIASDVDTRTDIYSLGALLYELLTGHPPFDHAELLGAGLEEMCRIIRTVEPVSPSERLARMPGSERIKVAAARGLMPVDLHGALEGDLDWITLKALEKLRDRRYATAVGLAEDITRHFEHLPVRAAAPSRRYKLTKLLKRNRKLAITTSIVAALLLTSAFVTIFMALNAHTSANQARASEVEAFQAERQSHRALVAIHVSSGLAAADALHPDRAVLWFANAARIADPNDYQSEINARRALCWMNRVSMPIGAFKLPSTLQFLDFSHDSRYVLAVGRDHSWQLWDVRTQHSAPLTTDVYAVQTAAWSPEGARLALVIPDGEIRVYDVAGGRLLHSFRISPAPATVEFSPDSRYLVVGDSSLHIYDLNQSTFVGQVPVISQDVVGLAYSARSTRMVVVTADDQAQVLEMADASVQNPGIPQAYPHRHVVRTDSCTSKSNYREDFLETPVLALPALVEEGTRMLTRTGPYEITFWDLASGVPVHRVDKACCSCRFITSPEAGLLACGLQGGTVGLWDIATAKQYRLLPSHGACILDIAFGMAGRNLITAEANGMARIWSIEEAKELQSPLHHCTDVDQVAFARNDRMVATGQSDGLVRIWNVFDDLVPPAHSLPGDDVPMVVQMDGRGQQFVFTREPSWDATIRQLTVYSAGSERPAGATLLFDAGVEAAAFSPNSHMLAVGIAPRSRGARGRVEFLDLSSMRLTGKPIALPSVPASLAWNPVTAQLAVVCRTGELLTAQPGVEAAEQWQGPVKSYRSRVNPMTAFTHNGRALISLGPDGSIHVRDASSGTLLYPPLESPPNDFWSFAVSRDDHVMATTTIGGDVAIWDLENGVRTGGILQHPGWVYRCRFGPNQDTLVTAAHDGKVRLWDLRTGSLRSGPLFHPGEVYDAALTPDNRWLLSACRDGNIRIWEPQSGQLIAPPIKVGHQALNIEFTTDGRYAVIGNLGEDVFTLPLGLLQEDLPYDVQDLCLLGEVVSGCTLENGAIHDLTTSEWLERYARIRRLHPDAFQMGRSYGLERRTLEQAVAFSDLRASPGPATGSADRFRAAPSLEIEGVGDVCTCDHACPDGPCDQRCLRL